MVLASASVALVAAISALRAGFRLRRTRIELQIYFSAEVVRLAERATVLEKNLAALDASRCSTPAPRPYPSGSRSSKKTSSPSAYSRTP